MIEVISLAHKFNLFSELWHPKIVGELNASYVKLVRLRGEFVWHRHEEEDEMFLVVDGLLTIRLRDRDLFIRQGEFVIIPKGVEHQPVATEEVQALLIEPKTTVNTGNIRDQMTVDAEWIRERLPAWSPSPTGKKGRLLLPPPGG